MRLSPSDIPHDVDDAEMLARVSSLMRDISSERDPQAVGETVWPGGRRPAAA